MRENLGIYIHIPFCVRKCDYCDFLSAPSDKKTMESYVDALQNEIILNRDRMKEYLVDTVFIGGGTPSILEGQFIVSIMENLRKNCSIKSDAEITIECNPGTVTKEKLLLYKMAGINRLSFGLQSADDEELKSIGRIHTFAEFLDSYNIARECEFDNVNIDLMSALPGQTVDSYKETLKKVIDLNPEHISAYSLIVEEGTRMKERVEQAERDGVDILPDEEAEREMYHVTKEILAKAGYSRYEISNYARSGMECSHNIGYWKRKDYLGFGVGAASLYKEERFNNVSDIKLYMRNLCDSESGINDSNNERFPEILSLINENKQKLSKEEQMEEFMFLGLRLTRGISKTEFKQMFDVEYEEIYGVVTEKLINEKLIIQTGDRIMLTEWGFDVSNYVMADFML